MDSGPTHLTVCGGLTDGSVTPPLTDPIICGCWHLQVSTNGTLVDAMVEYPKRFAEILVEF